MSSSICFQPCSKSTVLVRRLASTQTFSDNFTHVVGLHVSLEIAADTQKHICVKINFLYSIPNISYVITDILVLIFKQEIMLLHQKMYVSLTSYNQSSPVWHQCSQCDQLLNIRCSFPTCTFLIPGKPKSISK